MGEREDEGWVRVVGYLSVLYWNKLGEERRGIRKKKTFLRGSCCLSGWMGLIYTVEVENSRFAT